MSTLTDLISQIPDQELRTAINQELQKQQKFGLVFEHHVPEPTVLYGLPIKKSSKVISKTDNTIFKVDDIKDEVADCINTVTQAKTELPIQNLVSIAEFGKPIYPYLRQIDTICNAPNNPLWHILIEADNYHALQLLEYFYTGKVDCIYIDPPYNTGDRNWKYNNNYTNTSDSYRHSKWLSMMEIRLKLAKKLLNPKDSVLIIAIDEKEYLHLGCLLEELFPEACIQMITT